jgi:hypothetical protein
MNDLQVFYYKYFPINLMFEFVYTLSGMYDLLIPDFNYKPIQLEFSTEINSNTNRNLFFKDILDLQNFVSLYKLERLDYGGIYLSRDTSSSNDGIEYIKKNPLLKFDPLLWQSFKLEVDLNIFDKRKCCKAEKKCCNDCWNEYSIPIMKYLKEFFKGKVFFFYSGNKSLYIYPYSKIWHLIHDNEKFKLRIILLLQNNIQEKYSQFYGYNIFDTQLTMTRGHTIRCPFSTNKENIVFPIFDIDSSLNDLTLKFKHILINDSEDNKKFFLNILKFETCLKSINEKK